MKPSPVVVVFALVGCGIPEAVAPPVELVSRALAAPCSTTVPNGGLIDVNGNIFDANGVQVIPTCDEAAPVPDTVVAFPPPPPDPLVDPTTAPAGGYQSYVQVLTGSQNFNRIDATFVVPPFPPIRDGHEPLIAIFPGLNGQNPPTGFSTGILQPVLMWGPWTVQGDQLDHAWRIAAVVCHRPTVDDQCHEFHTDSWPVNVGDHLTSSVVLSSTSGNIETWLLFISNDADNLSPRFLQFQTDRTYETMNVAVPLALEAYNLQDCEDLPLSPIVAQSQPWRWGPTGPGSFSRDLRYVNGHSLYTGWILSAAYPPQCNLGSSVTAPTFPNSPLRNPPTITLTSEFVVP
jgi:hypothetical protein